MALADTFKAEKIIKLPWWQKVAAVAVVAVAIVALYFLTLDRTYTQQIKSLNNDIAGLEKQITDLQTIAKDLPKFERQNALLKKELDKAMTKLPSQEQIDELLKDITVKAKTNGVEVASFERQTNVQQSLYIGVPVAMKLQSNFFPLMIFLNELARMERIVNISDLQIKRAKAAMLDVTCTLTAYRFKEQEQATPPATGAKK